MTVKHNIKFVSHTDGNGHIELWQEETSRKNQNEQMEFIDTEYETFKEKIVDEYTKEKDSEGKNEKVSVSYIIHSVQLFRFELKRKKSKISRKEQIEIEAFHEDMQYGKIMLNMMRLRDEFSEFKKYGVVLSRSIYNDISSCIENNYLKLQADMIDFIETELTDSVVDDIFDMFCAYIKEYPFPSVKVDGKHMYPIPVEKFDNYLKDSDYSVFGTTDIRKAFKSRPYSHTNTGRNDYFAPPCGEEEKKFKAIAFIGELVDKVNKS